MTTTINASTSSGLVQTADTSGALAIQTANTTAISITSGQVVSVVNDATINGLTVGKGGGALAGNTALGTSALGSNTNAVAITAIGYQAGFTMNPAAGTYNDTFVGYQSGYSNTTGYNNTFLGGASGYTTSTGASNTAVGFQSLYSNTTASNNTAVGYQAGYSQSGGSPNITAVGYQALYLNTTGTNDAFGIQALGANTTGDGCAAFGFQALRTNTTGGSNTAMGLRASYLNSTGGANTAIGREALYSNTADNNTAVGYQAGYANTSGAQNTFIGRLAGAGVTTGYSNTIIGNGAANDTGPLTTGFKNTIVGAYCDVSAVGADTQIVLGYDVTSAGNSTVTLGANTGKVYNAFTVNATWTQTSDGRLKTNITPDTLGLSFINRLNPVTFTWKPSNELEKDNPYYAEENERNTTTVIHGLIAQEVKAAMEAEGCTTFNGWDEGEDGIQAISREMFITPLIKAIQEQQALITQLQADVAALKGAK